MVARGYEITNIFEALRAEKDLAVGDFDNAAWSRARAAQIARYWSDERALTVRFDCQQSEPLVVSAAPRLDQKTIGLWDRDVCELFITPEAGEIKHYFEFEVAPTGEWIDLALTVRPQGRETDWHFRSHMTVAARVRQDNTTLSMRVPWKALSRTPRAS